MHFVNDADQLLLLLLDNSAFQEQAALFEFQSASWNEGKENNHDKLL